MTTRRKKTLALVLGVAALVGGWAYWRLFRIHGFIIALAPVDAGRAVVVLRANEEHGRPSRGYVGLMDAGGSWIWWKKLDGLPAGASARNGLLVSDGAAFVRTELTTGRGATSAYAIDSGDVLWSMPFEESRADTYLDLMPAGTHLVQGNESHNGRPIRVLDRRTGRVEATHESDHFDIFRTQVRGENLVLEGLFGIKTMPIASTTPPVSIPLPGGCIDHDDYVALRIEAESYRVVAVPLTGGAERVVVPAQPLPFGVSTRPWRCARYGEDLAFLVAESGQKTVPVGLLTTRPKDGSQVGFGWLGIELFDFAISGMDANDKRFPESAAFDGTIPRFVPLFVLTHESGGGHRTQLVVLDVAERRIARRGRPLATGLVESDFRSGDVFYLQSSEDDGPTMLGRFDGTSGKLTAAARPDRNISVPPYAVAGDRVWIYSGDWRTPLPFATVDAKTLAVSPGAAMKITEAREDGERMWFGAAP